MPKYSGGVSWKFGNGISQDSNCIVRDQFTKGRQSEDNMEEETQPEHCLKPSQMLAAFGGSKQGVKNGDNKAKESPKVAAKKKKTTFTWVPANQDKLSAKDDDATKDDVPPKENISSTDDIVCDSVDISSSKDAFKPDVPADVVEQDNDSSKGSNCSNMDEDNSQSSLPRNDDLDIDRVDSPSPCEERTSSPPAAASPGDGLDANANPEQEIPTNWPSMDSTNTVSLPETADEQPTEDIPLPPSGEDTGVQDKVEAAAEGQSEEVPTASSDAGDNGGVELEKDVKDQDEDTEAPPRPSPPSQPPQPPAHHQNGPADDPRLGGHGMTNSHQTSAAPQPPAVPEPPAVPRSAPPAAPPAPPVPTGGPPQPPSPQTSAAPPPPGAPPAAPPAPPGPPPPPGGAGGPPPPPPPPPPPGPGGAGGGGSGGGGGGGNDLAAQLAAAKLKKATPKADSGDPPAKRPGGPGGMSMMADLQRKLQARKQKSSGEGDAPPAASKERISPPEPKTSTPRPWEREKNNRFNTNGTVTPASPKTGRRSSINSKENGSSGDNVDFDRMKQEIMVEMRKEIGKMKEEIIEAIKLELSRR